MPQFTVANLQYTASHDEAKTLAGIKRLMADAKGADLICLPECATRMDADKSRLIATADHEADSASLKELKAMAVDSRAYLLIGSMVLKHDDPRMDGKLANRSLLITPDGAIKARYDKIHMFDADVGDGRPYAESATYAPGAEAVIAKTDLGVFGMTICYDLRYPHLYHALAKNGAEVLFVPSAFTKKSGAAHWHSLLRARAIETGSFIIAPAQTGQHDPDPSGLARETYGHSLIINPWGDVLADAGGEPSVTTATINTEDAAIQRRAIPSLTSARDFTVRFSED